jgi:hypothetical protein
MGRRGMHLGYWWERQKKRDHWEDQDVGEWTIDMPQDRDQWRALVNMVLNLWVT